MHSTVFFTLPVIKRVILFKIMSQSHILHAIHKISKAVIFPNKANKCDKDNFICAECNCNVVLHKGQIRRPYFAHKPNSGCNYYTPHSNEDPVHKQAKWLIKHAIEQNTSICIQSSCSNNCGTTSEDQLALNSDESVFLEHRFEHNGAEKVADVACVRNTDRKIQYIVEICHTHKTSDEDRPEPWFELDATETINAFFTYYSGAAPSGSEQNEQATIIQLRCIRKWTCEDCIAVSLQTTNIAETKEGDTAAMNVPQPRVGKVYLNQRGAGCGKTYESIQLVQLQREQFRNKNLFIYLTKMHTVKEVILCEFKEQEARGSLSDVELCGENTSGNQYTIQFRYKATNQLIRVVIGTIDSFQYAVVDKNKITPHSNYFYGIVNAVANGHIKTDAKGAIWYAGTDRVLNDECLIIVDEAQDLAKEYIEAFQKLIDRTCLDVFVIGDKLQSIWDERNIFTCLENNELPLIHVERSEGINKVLRFHNAHLKEFVNAIVPFQKYGLPEISEIYDGNHCRYATHEDHVRADNTTPKPYHVFEMPVLYNDDNEWSLTNAFCDQIVGYMEAEIDAHKYLPHNFMFIFPFPGKDNLVAPLSSRIQDFWIHKFNEANYQEEVLIKDDYWKRKMDNVDNGHIDQQHFDQLVFVHKHEEGKSINLKDSERATRFLSIHASKGLGCEVVFVLNLTESALVTFSKQRGNLVYDSLLHVAITRQKKSIYIGIRRNNDDIHKKFEAKTYIEQNTITSPDMSRITKRIQLDKILAYVTSNEKVFASFHIHFLQSGEFANVLPKTNNKKAIIDWGHHTLRYSVMMFYFMLNIYNGKKADGSSGQFYAELQKMTQMQVSSLPCGLYNKHLHEITQNNRERKYDKNKVIPILSFHATDVSKYAQYRQALENIIRSIQEKIRDAMSKRQKLPNLCPLECVVLLYSLHVLKDGTRTPIHPMDVYSVMYCYDCCLGSDKDEHSKNYGCHCSRWINNSAPNTVAYPEIQSSLYNHYNIVERIKTIYGNIKKHVDEKCSRETMEYNILHPVHMSLQNNHFSIRAHYQVIGCSENHVMCCLFKPQFNQCNFNEVICEVILSHFLILNNCPEHTTNHEKYANKKIHICVVTLDSETPIFFAIDLTEKQKQVMLSEILKNYLIETYSAHHEQIYNFYKYCENTKPNADISSVKHTLQRMEEIDKKNHIIPEYIYDFFRRVQYRLSDLEDMCVPLSDIRAFLNNQVKIKDNCVGNLNNCLKASIDSFLGIGRTAVVRDY